MKTLYKKLKIFFFENLGVQQTIAKNTFWLTLSEIIPKGLTVLLAIMIARYLGVENFGKFSFAFSFALIFSVIIDFGLVPFTTREVSRNNSLAPKYIGNITAIKFILALLLFVTVAFSLNFLNKPKEIEILVYFASAWVVLQSFSHFFQSAFRAFEKMEYVALSKTIYSIVLFTAVSLAVFLNLGIVSLVQSYVVAVLVSLSVTLTLMWKKFTKFKIEADFLFWQDLFKEVWPFVAFTVFSVIYFQISTVMLSLMDGDLSAGLYSAAFNSVAVFLVLSDIVSGSALPSLSRLFGKSDLFSHLTKKLVVLMLALGVLLATVLFFASPFLIKLIYGEEFARSIPAFQIMVWILPFRFMNYIFGISLMAANLQKRRLGAAMVCAIFNVAVNFILIPRFSIIGASIAALATELTLFFLYFNFYKKIFKSA